MKTAPRKSAKPFSKLLGKRKAAPKSKAATVSKPFTPQKSSTANHVSKAFAGPAHLVAANLLWGPDRLWPRDEAGERALPWQASEGVSIGILGAGLGAWAATVARQVPTATITEFDWRSDVARWRVEREKILDIDSELAVAQTAFHEINSNIILPPPVRCSCILGVEPILAQVGSDILRWARLALEPGGVMVLEELTADTPSPSARGVRNGWMARGGQSAQWLRIDEMEATLRRNGFILGKVRERTGAHLRALRLELDEVGQRLEPLNKAIKQVPSLKKVADHFNCELNAAKNRLVALEQGTLAVYRIEVIKPRADELI